MENDESILFLNTTIIRISDVSYLISDIGLNSQFMV